MRVMIAMLMLGCSLIGPAAAGDLSDRLDRLDYGSRSQRYDLDIVMRQRALDDVDAADRAAHASERAAIDRLERGPLGDVTAPMRPGWPRN